jgi:diguanylate cyclase (GGDEF)-like protein/PAS domain S-box-containing protein
MATPASVGNFTLDSELRFLSFEAGDGATLPSDARTLLGRSVWDAFDGSWRSLLYPGLRRAQRERVGVKWEAVHTETETRYAFEIEPRSDSYRVRYYVIPPTPQESPAPPAKGSRTRNAIGAEVDDAYFQRAADMLVVLSATEGKILKVNPAWSRSVGYSAESIEGRSLLDLTHPDDRADAYAALQHTLRSETDSPIHFTCRIKNQSGEWRYLQWFATPHPEADQVYAAARDVTESRTTELAMRRQATTDALTELLNRRGLEEELTRALIEAGRQKKHLAVVFIDLDRFKPINDSFGHEIGDQMLQVVAGRLTAAVRGRDLVARLGGDEFVVALTEIASPSDAEAVAQKLLLAVTAPTNLAGHELFVTASIGISVYPTDGPDADTLIKNADAAMYKTKHSGRAGVALYSEKLPQAEAARITIESGLSKAIERGELRLFYQEQRHAKTGNLVGFEALLRWHHAEHGVIGPGQFIPLAEETGLIVPMGAWAMGEAARQASVWETLADGLNMSVNVSPRQFAEGDRLVQSVRDALSESAFHPERLDLEITESMLAGDSVELKRTLHRLKDLGVKLSLDDFGTGYSALAMLPQLPFDRVKIDRSFIERLCESEKDEAVVRLVIELSHTLGMKVVAEGVETLAQYEKLTTLGCDVLQGYFFGKPLPPGEVPLLLSSKGA